MSIKRQVLGGLFDRISEAPKVQADAKAKGLTVSNYFRVLTGFEPLQSGTPVGRKSREAKLKKTSRD